MLIKGVSKMNMRLSCSKCMYPKQGFIKVCFALRSKLGVVTYPTVGRL